MAIQYKKKAAANVPNAIDADHVYEFIDSADNTRKTKDNLGNVTTSVSGVSYVNGNSGAITSAQIKTAYEANSDTNAFTDAEKTKLAGLGGGSIVTSKLAANFTHNGANTTIPVNVPSLSLTNLAVGSYQVEWTIFLSQPLVSSAYKPTFNLNHNAVSTTKLNGLAIEANIPSFVREGTAKELTNYGDANEQVIYKFTTILQVGTANSGITFQFWISQNSSSYVPTLHKGSKVELEAL